MALAVRYISLTTLACVPFKERQRFSNGGRAQAISNVPSSTGLALLIVPSGARHISASIRRNVSQAQAGWDTFFRASSPFSPIPRETVVLSNRGFERRRYVFPGMAAGALSDIKPAPRINTPLRESPGALNIHGARSSYERLSRYQLAITTTKAPAAFFLSARTSATANFIRACEFVGPLSPGSRRGLTLSRAYKARKSRGFLA